MKKHAKKLIVLGIVAVLLALMLTVILVICLSGNRKKVKINDVNDVLLNPGKGWVDYTDAFWQGYGDIINLGYLRFDWSYIEPQKGQYNWQNIDRYIDAYSAIGKKFAFGVMCANVSSLESYVTPEWVFDEGAKYVVTQTTSWKDGSTITQYIPDWKDEIFLRNLNDFVNALGERYDGNENIAFIDIRSYGNWGEQHLFHIIDDDNYEYIINNRLTPEELKELYIKPYMQAFPNTMLCNPWGEKIYDDVYKWAIDNGVTVRRDGVIGVSDGTECAMAENKLPTIFEYTYNYRTMVDMGLWNTDDLLQYVKNGKPSYMQFYIDMYEENKEFCDYLANYMGYYFRLKEAQFDNEVKLSGDKAQGGKTNVTLKFKNDGVAPIFDQTYAYIALLNEDDEVVAKFKTDIDARTWKPGEEKTESIDLSFDGIETGTYKLAFGLFQNETDEHPAYLFGSEGKTDNKWYVFGKTMIID